MRLLMKGRCVYTFLEIERLKMLIIQRNKADRDKQKSIRRQMRELGFFGGDDFGIRDCKLEDLDRLIRSGKIKVIGEGTSISQTAKLAVTKKCEAVVSCMNKTGLAPWVGDSPKVLILGSLPSDESISQQAYYCNPRNFFWNIMRSLFREMEIDNKKFITSHGIALWDCIYSADRSGSLDSNIKEETVVYNNIEEFLVQHPTIRTIVFNGQKAEKYFRKQNINIDCEKITLISTSSAAAKSLEDRLDNWSIIKELVK